MKQLVLVFSVVVLAFWTAAALADDASETKERRLVELLPDWRLPDWPVNAIYPTRDRAARVTHFAQELRINLRQQLPPGSEL